MPAIEHRSTHSGRRTLDFFTRDLTARDVATALVGLAAMIAAFGWTINSPGKQIRALDTRVTQAEHRIDTLAEQQRFTNYMLCVNARRTDPASAPPDCTPIIDARNHR